MKPWEVQARPRLLFLATEYYFFAALQKEIAPEIVARAFDISVAANCDNSGDGCRGSRFSVIVFDWKRSRSLASAALQFLPELVRVRRLLRETKPDILHNIALKPSIIGSLAALGSDTRIVNSINGLGFLFFARSPFATVGQWLCAQILKLAVTRNNAQILLLNTKDVDFVRRRLGIPRNVRLVRGSGIDLRHFRPLPPPVLGAPFRFLVISRLLYMKGIHVVVAAHRLLRQSGFEAELVICGAPDTDNPSSIPKAVVDEWSRLPGIRFLGQIADVRPEIGASHVVIHAALGGEGLPRVLLEGAACERALIATDVAGNSDVVVADETGILVPPDDAAALAGAMERAIAQPAERATWAKNALEKVRREFASELIAESHARIYDELCPFLPVPPP